jgi:hypothetical protein
MVKGLQNVLNNLNKEVSKIKKRSLSGLLKAGFILERDSNKHVPIETGVLRASSYVRRAQDNRNAVQIGYSSSYAIFVHENVEMILKGKQRPSGLGKYWGPQGEAKFLENSITRKSKDMIRAIVKEAKINDR